MPERRASSPRRWCFGLVLLMVLQGCSLLEHRITSQRELSRTVGVFRPSRYVTFESVDDADYHFKENSSFGPLGPSGRFKMATNLISIRSQPSALITYEHDAGRFRVRLGDAIEYIEADFTEPYTQAEEAWLLASNTLKRLPAGASVEDRVDALLDAMNAAFGAGHLDEARRIGDEALRVVAGVAPKRGEYSRTVHKVRTTLGRVALSRGDVAAARAELLASADVPGSPTMRSFGPNMSLARDLLRAGERSVVLDYLDRCRAFWPDPALDRWRDEIEAGKTPEFGGNLRY